MDQVIEQLGDYTLLKKLGEGPFGEVFLAEHRFIKRPFVIKILPQEITSNPSFMRRFEAEIAEIASLDHPNIVKIHNVSFADEKYFLVTDPKVDSLDQAIHLERYLKLKGSSLVEEDFISILSQIASALDYAHNLQLFHGALKLTNILVEPKEEGVRVLLSDFGLTRLVGEKLSLTRLAMQLAKHFPSTSFVSAYAFLAPEQKGIEPDLSQKTDAFAFGVLAYYLLFKKVPEGCFELPSRVLPNMEKNWDFLINRCLQSDPNLRPENLQQALKTELDQPKALLKDMLYLSDLPPQKEDDHLQMAFPLEVEGPQQEKETSEEQEESLSQDLQPLLKPQEIQRPEYEPDPGAVFQREMQVSYYTPKKEQAQDVEPIFTDMIVVPGGTYMRGSKQGARDEMPRHAIQLNSFAIDIHPVSNE